MSLLLTPAALQPVAAWTRWLTRLLLGSLYPGAPFERKFLAMLLLEALLSTWNSPDKANRQNFRHEMRPLCCHGCRELSLHSTSLQWTDRWRCLSLTKMRVGDGICFGLQPPC